MKKGLTIVEMMVSFGILVVVLAGIFLILRLANWSWDIDSGKLDLQQYTRLVMENMIREISQSNHDELTVNNGGARLDFLVPNVTNMISYYVSNGQLIRSHAGTNTPIASHIDSVTFTLLDAENLEIQIQARKTVKNRVLTFPLTEKVRLRNE